MPPAASTAGVAARILRLCATGERSRVLLGLVLLLGHAGVAVLQPWPLKLVLDSVLGDVPGPTPVMAPAEVLSQSLALPGPVALLLLLCLSLLALQLLGGVLNVLSTYVLVSVGLRMVYRLRCALFDHVQRLSLSFHDATPVGDSLYRVVWDSYAAQALFNSAIVPSVGAAVTLLGIAAAMLSLDRAVTLAALAIGVPLVLLIRRLDRPMTERSLRVHERESAVSARVQETLGGIRTVQAFGREWFEEARFRGQAEASLRANLVLTVLQTATQVAVGLLLAAGMAAVVWIGATGVMAGRLTVGGVVLLVAYVSMLYKPLETLSYTAAVIQSAAAGGRRVLAVLDLTPDVVDAPGAIELEGRIAGRIAFHGVSFWYRGDQPVLRDLSFEVPAGTTVALVGPSGAGKTTLASLLLRFYEPTAGRITLDGHDLRDLTVASLRRNIALVLQEPVLFSATIGENIAYGRSEAGPEDVVAAAQLAGAHEFIRSLPDGYETHVGERGVALSGGQRQRLAIARAFLKDAPVLILDEPTGALDAETEEQLLETLARLTKGRTTLIIAHRMSTIRRADRIVVLEDGVPTETGTHAELLARAGRYARLHALQVGPSGPLAPAGGE